MAAGRILLVMEHCGVGDALRLSFAPSAVREACPTAEIVLVVAAEALGVFEHFRLCDRIVPSRLFEPAAHSRLGLRVKKLRELLAIVWKVGLGYDLVIIFGGGSRVLSILAWLVGRGRRIGYAPGSPRWLTSRLGPIDPQGDPVSQNLELLRAAGIEPGRAAPILRYTPQDEAAASHLLKEKGVSRSLVVLHPGSDWACQQWLPERWSQLADQLAVRWGADIVFTGLLRERGYIEAIQGQMRARSTCLAGQTTLHQLAALLSLARLCVCVDSAVFEVTQAVGVPTVVLAGATDPAGAGRDGLAPVVVNRTPAELRASITVSKEQKKDMAWLNGRWFCFDYACPMAGLRDVSVADVLQAVEECWDLAPARGQTTPVGAFDTPHPDPPPRGGRETRA